MKQISKDELQRMIEQNWSTETIARCFNVSPRTITRRIKQYLLTELRPRGRKTKT